MRKAGILILLLMIFQVLLYAQENGGEEEPEIEPDWDVYTPDLYSAGDQLFIITFGAAFPTVFFNNGEKIEHNISPPVGLAGSLSYCYFITPSVFLGGELSGKVFWTLGKNTVYLIPIGLRAGYQFLFWRLEFPLNLTLGMTWHRYLDKTYYGLYIKGGGSAFFRFNQEWSFGINTNWYWLPEWTKDKSKDVDGNIIDLTLSVRYHF